MFSVVEPVSDTKKCTWEVSRSVNLLPIQNMRNGHNIQQGHGTGSTAVALDKSTSVPETERVLNEAITPIYGPTIVPPLPWTSPSVGGYHSSERSDVFRVSLMRFKSKEQMKDIAAAGREVVMEGRSERPRLAQVYQALNCLGQQRWRINSEVLRVRFVSCQLLKSRRPSFHTAALLNAELPGSNFVGEEVQEVSRSFGSSTTKRIETV
jgi:hypothetical protein